MEVLEANLLFPAGGEGGHLLDEIGSAWSKLTISGGRGILLDEIGSAWSTRRNCKKKCDLGDRKTILTASAVNVFLFKFVCTITFCFSERKTFKFIWFLQRQNVFNYYLCQVIASIKLYKVFNSNHFSKNDVSYEVFIFLSFFFLVVTIAVNYSEISAQPVWLYEGMKFLI